MEFLISSLTRQCSRLHAHGQFMGTPTSVNNHLFLLCHVSEWVDSYNKAREIKTAQDQYCNAVLGGDWATLNKSPFPEDLQWEALVDVLRGRVKVQVHCYEALDLDDFVRVSSQYIAEIDVLLSQTLKTNVADPRVPISCRRFPSCTWSISCTWHFKEGLW